MGLFDTLFNFGANASMQQQAYNNQRKLNEQMYELNKNYTKWSLKNVPKRTRQGLERAGYNPIIGAMNSTAGTGSISSSSAGVAGTGNPGNFDEVNAFRAFKTEREQLLNQNRTTEATVNATNAQADLNRQQALTEEAKRTQMDFQNAMYDVEKHLKQKELSWADRKFYSEIYDNMQRAENYGAMASVARYNAQTERTNSATNAMNAETNRINAKTGIARAVGTGIVAALGITGGAGLLSKAGYLKRSTNAKQAVKALGQNGFRSSLAKYFTTLH